MTSMVSTYLRSSRSPSSARVMRLPPSNRNGLVTTATVSALSSRATLATIGVAPVPVPPPIPAVTPPPADADDLDLGSRDRLFFKLEHAIPPFVAGGGSAPLPVPQKNSRNLPFMLSTVRHSPRRPRRPFKARSS